MPFATWSRRWSSGRGINRTDGNVSVNQRLPFCAKNVHKYVRKVAKSLLQRGSSLYYQPIKANTLTMVLIDSTKSWVEQAVIHQTTPRIVICTKHSFKNTNMCSLSSSASNGKLLLFLFNGIILPLFKLMLRDNKYFSGLKHLLLLLQQLLVRLVLHILLYR